jgi:hypothetical protein
VFLDGDSAEANDIGLVCVVDMAGYVNLIAN